MNKKKSAEEAEKVRSQTMIEKREKEERIENGSAHGNQVVKSGTIYSKQGNQTLNIFERFKFDLSEKNKELEEVKAGFNS